jgi:hypothetical protein
MNDNYKRPPMVGGRPLPMAEQIRRAGDQAVPMLVSIHLRACVEASSALYALTRDEEDGGPDPAAAEERLGRLLRLLLTGEV